MSTRRSMRGRGAHGGCSAPSALFISGTARWRCWSLALAAGIAALVRKRHAADRALTLSGVAVIGLVAAQIGLGLAMAYVALTPALQVGHLTASSLLLGAETVLWLLRTLAARQREYGGRPWPSYSEGVSTCVHRVARCLMVLMLAGCAQRPEQPSTSTTPAATHDAHPVDTGGTDDAARQSRLVSPRDQDVERRGATVLRRGADAALRLQSRRGVPLVRARRRARCHARRCRTGACRSRSAPTTTTPRRPIGCSRPTRI